MDSLYSKEEQYLLFLLRTTFGKHPDTKTMEAEKEEIDMQSVVAMAKRHAVLSFLYDVSQKIEGLQACRSQIELEVRQTVQQSYRLLFLTRYIVNQLKEQGISCIVLKGVMTGSLYPVPELRKSGDIDLLVSEKLNKGRLIRLMEQMGFPLVEEQHANHHIAFMSQKGIQIEIHTMLTEEFSYGKLNRAMKKHGKRCWDTIQEIDVMGVMLPGLTRPFHAYELLVHMLHHFMRTGFGLKLLCDWVMLWQQEWTEEEKVIYQSLVKESGLKKFGEMISSVCIRWLGMEECIWQGEICPEKSVDIFLRELLDSGEFGAVNNDRMVMLQGTGVWDYVKEFHYQMRLNYPVAGKCFLFWPVLWSMTLLRFLRNNHRLRGTSTRNILKEAARRSKLMKEIQLFR